MEENAKEELNELFTSLRRNNAPRVADEISRVIARGVTEEIEIEGRTKELSQRPLTAEEAYKLAVEMLVASLEPMILRKHALLEFEKISGGESSIKWLQDFVEKSPISPETYEEIAIPELPDVQKLEEDLKLLVELLGEV